MASLGRVNIGQYEILHTLGAGSFGKVKLAVHSLTGHKVAIKMVNRMRMEKLQLNERVRREIRHLQRLQHPHIIKLYEVIMTPTEIIMVMEYAGGELFDYIACRERLTDAEARRFFQQLISALDYCHREKVVHRDLKPENLMLDDHNNIKIADFGLSSMLSDGEFLRTSCGSPNYAAPEIITGKLYAGPEVDIWSCGVILYVMLCGVLPFDDEHIPTLFRKISAARYHIPSHVSAPARDLLKRMLTVDPVQRITIPEIWQHPWVARDMPDYLLELSLSGAGGLGRPVDPDYSDVDEEVLDALQKKLGISSCEMRTALTEPSTNPVKVAYQLSIDKRRSFEEASGSRSGGIGSPLVPYRPRAASEADTSNATKAAAAAAAAAGLWPAASSIRVLSSSLPTPPDTQPHLPYYPYLQYTSRARRIMSSLRRKMPPTAPASPSLGHDSATATLHSLAATAAAAASNTTATATPATTSDVGGGRTRRNTGANGSGSVRPRWHLGIRCQGQPLHVMDELYRALAQLDMRWKSLDPFRLRVLYRTDASEVKIDLQLYMMSAQMYLLDFCQVVPRTTSAHKTTTATTNTACQPHRSPFPFLEACALLITELALPTSA